MAQRKVQTLVIGAGPGGYVAAIRAAQLGRKVTVVEREFLGVPQEALVATMETNQKFFPVLDAGGKLTEHFIGIANIESKDASEIRKGYERVIRPRFADAKFFFDEDLKQGLEAMGDGLKTVTYQAKLGSVADKAARVAALAEAIAPQVGADAALARRAALLAKNGFSGPLTVLEGEHGFFHGFAPSRTPDFDVLLRGLGEQWLMTTIAFKPYACGTMTQPYVDCAIELAQRGVSADVIESIACEVGEGTVHPARRGDEGEWLTIASHGEQVRAVIAENRALAG